ncbi:MAG: hypothetical protein OEU09_18915, partial [Rhodospirillales bacterium]|nr:hypothetical protein [Rhodospirillales bacterium]
AAARADEMMDQGDVDGFAIWQRITAAAEELLRPEPRPGERVQWLRRISRGAGGTENQGFAHAQD